MWLCVGPVCVCTHKGLQAEPLEEETLAVCARVEEGSEHL